MRLLTYKYNLQTDARPLKLDIRLSGKNNNNCCYRDVKKKNNNFY